MHEFVSRPAFVAFALSCVVLSLNLFVLAGITGAGRGMAKVFVNPEDVRQGGKLEAVDAERVARVMRAHRNAIENFVPFAILGLLYVIMGASARGAYILFGTYVAARILHSIMYLGGKQPWRTIFYAVGALATLGLMIQITRAAIGMMM